MANQDRREKLKVFLFGVLLVCLVLLTGELLATVLVHLPPEPYPMCASPPAGQEMYEYDPELLWRLRPNMVSPDGLIRTNALGLRDGEFPSKREGERFTVLALGDSPTFGFRVTGDEAYPGVLKRLLSESRPEIVVEVLNGGTPAYSTMQSLALEKQLLRRWHFDLVIVNNMGSDRRLQDMEDKTYRRSELGYKALKILSKSRLLSVLRSVMTGRSRDGMPRPVNAVSRVSTADYAANLGEMIKAAKAQGGEVILFAPPELYDSPAERVLPEEKKLEPEYQQAMRKAAEDGGAFFVDVPLKMKKLQDPASFYIDATHPTAEGHVFIAKALLEPAGRALEKKYPPPAR